MGFEVLVVRAEDPAGGGCPLLGTEQPLQQRGASIAGEADAVCWGEGQDDVCGDPACVSSSFSCNEE